jgi:hypothetical protein
MRFVLRALVFVGCIAWINALSFAASSAEPKARIDESYQDTGGEVSAEVTLSASAGLISTVTVPSWAKGVRFYPRTNHVRFSIQDGETSRVVAAVGTASAGAAVSTTTVTTGGIAKNDMWETRLLPFTGRQRYIYLRSTTASVVVDLEFF